MKLEVFSASCVFLVSCCALGQVRPAVAVSGTVLDPSGARVTGAAVEVRSPEGATVSDAVSDGSGRFQLTLVPGHYNLVVTADGFDPLLMAIQPNGSSLLVQAKLVIATAQSVVTVNSDNGASMAEDANGSAVTLGNKELATLSDDDATFQQQLTSLAGGDGQHAPQIYVDGFTGGQFPPKSSIRSIKINQNPFSAEYDGLGFGRIEILTKPGTGQLHGSVDITGDPSGFNSRNPFLQAAEPGYYRLHTQGNLSGPLGKKTSFFVSGDYYDQQNNAIVNAQTSNSGGGIVTLSLAVPDPQATSSYTVRLDRQWSTNNTVTARYEFDRSAQTNAGLSQFILPSEAYGTATNTSTLQLGNAQVLGAHAELNTKFEWVRTRNTQNPESNAPAILVQGTVSDGGNPSQRFVDHQDHLEFQESGIYDHGKHFIRSGLRYRLYRDASLSTSGFNGAFTFSNLAAYQASLLGTPSASQFQLTRGQSGFSVVTGDLALWAEDEWKLRPNVTVDLGVRFESQSAIPDHADPSPHLGISWAMHQTDKKPAMLVLRGGAGIFYDRFPISALSTAVRRNNPNLQQTYTVTNPNFFANTAAGLQSTLAGVNLGNVGASTVYRVSPTLRSEYEVDAGATAEFHFGSRGSLSANYLLFRGIHQWESVNANAPLYNGSRPAGAGTGDVYQFNSGGELWGNVFFFNPQLNITKKIQYWGFLFTQPKFNSDTAGLTSFTSNSYNIHQDYGRSQYDRRYGLFTGIDADLHWGVHTGVFLATRGGTPFNLTTGQDNNGDSIYNDRPSFASAASNPANVVNTRFGALDTTPQAGERLVPINYGSSPRFLSLQVQMQKTVRFGPRTAEPVDPSAPPPPPPPPGSKPAPLPDPRYALVFSVEAQNVTNTVSPGTPIGVLSSAFFGRSINTANDFLTTTAANRTIMVHTAFRF